VKTLETESRVPSSFRDPSGFVYSRDGNLYRQVNLRYRNEYDQLMQSGLYAELVRDRLLIPHEEIDVEPAKPELAYKIIRPESLGFISYPYEWCFSQLKDAALSTLSIQKKALEFGMSLKDSSAFNIQFSDGQPLLIDTLSFEKYQEGLPWIAYRQFCQHFLAPLVLMSRRDVRLIQLFRTYIDGIPLDLASSLLPRRTYLSFPLLTHVHLHARSQRHFSSGQSRLTQRRMGHLSFLGLIDNLESAIKGLKWQPSGTEWAEYYEDTNYSHRALDHKKALISEFIARIRPGTVWDLGANLGMFSRLASSNGAQTVSFDIDPAAVERNYLECKANGETKLLPLLLDLTNPSPAIGWGNEERMSLIERGPADMVLGLALLHHLAISNNLPFDRIARFLSELCRWLVIEFVPKSDSQVQRLLSTREDIFTDYDRSAFEAEFGRYFATVASASIDDSERVLYLMENLRST